MTYGEIYKRFTEETGIPEAAIEDYRPCVPIYGVPPIERAIVIWLNNGDKLIYIPKT